MDFTKFFSAKSHGRIDGFDGGAGLDGEARSRGPTGDEDKLS